MKTRSNKKTEKKKTARLPLFIVLASIFLVCLAAAYFYLTGVFEYEIIKMDVAIGDYVGVNLDTDAVHFGAVDAMRSGELTREVVITNSAEAPKKIYLFKTGKISRWIAYSETAFLINPGQNETIAVKFTVPAAGISKGNYSGNLIAVSRKI